MMAMAETRVERRPVGLLGIVILSFFIPACSAPNGEPHPWLRPFSQDSNVVQRPTYEMPQRRTFFVSGYAGEDYGPGFRGRSVWTEPAESSTPGQPRVSVNQGTWEPE